MPRESPALEPGENVDFGSISALDVTRRRKIPRRGDGVGVWHVAVGVSCRKDSCGAFDLER